MQGLLTVQKIN